MASILAIAIALLFWLMLFTAPRLFLALFFLMVVVAMFYLGTEILRDGRRR